MFKVEFDHWHLIFIYFLFLVLNDGKDLGERVFKVEADHFSSINPVLSLSVYFTACQ